MGRPSFLGEGKVRSVTDRLLVASALIAFRLLSLVMDGGSLNSTSVFVVAVATGSLAYFVVMASCWLRKSSILRAVYGAFLVFMITFGPLYYSYRSFAPIAFLESLLWTLQFLGAWLSGRVLRDVMGRWTRDFQLGAVQADTKS